MKRVFSILLSLSLLLSSMTMDAYAENIESRLYSDDYLSNVFSQMSDSSKSYGKTVDSIAIIRARYLYDFANCPIAVLYEFSPKGYAIYDFETSIVLEYSKDDNHPFYVETDKVYYYNGVFEYYIAEDDVFVNLATGAIADTSKNYGRSNFYHPTESSMNSKLEMRATENPVYLANSTRFYNCNRQSNYGYFYPGFTEEEIADIPGVCGSVACAIMVAYYDDYKSSLAGTGDFATDWKKTGGSASSGTYGIDLVKEFVPLVELNGNGSIFLNPGMAAYLNSHGISGGCSLGILTVYQQTKNAIGPNGDGVPLIIGTSNHYCVAIGYKNIDGKKIFVNTGWGYSMWIDASTVVSTWTMFFN